ncbi:hypothetical protein ACFVW1_51070 [Streptomyces olivochromogenes]|uniref:hypothetical protein n=1 Tax=Streptomyces olivochromogenes TaxID=1963 RepID=UPI0036DAD954
MSPIAAADTGLPYGRILSGAPLSEITTSGRCGTFEPAATNGTQATYLEMYREQVDTKAVGAVFWWNPTQVRTV